MRSPKHRQRSRAQSLNSGVERDVTANPDWTREETILALEVYLRVRPRYASESDAAVQELSTMLNLYARQRDVFGASTFRNPFGVARKINKFRAAEAGRSAGSVGGAKLETAVWAEFGDHLRALAEEAGVVRAAIYAHEVQRDLAERAGDVPSRGPPPRFGSIVHDLVDSECVVYVLRLVGPVDHLFSDRALGGQIVVKVGRSNDVARRAIELNVGFPPRSAVHWQVHATRLFPGAHAAHDAEQQFLRRLESARLTIGKEFAIIDEQELDRLLLSHLS